MLDRIEEWRTKSVPQKRRYALTAAAVATLVITGIWASTLPTRLAVLDFDQSAAVIEAEAEKAEAARIPGIVPPEAPSRWSTFTDRIANGAVVIKNKIVGAPEEPPSPPVATTTPMAWTEVVEAKREPIIDVEGKPIMIEVATSAPRTATTTSDESVAATSSEDVIQ